jgi:hypothetical protein
MHCWLVPVGYATSGSMIHLKFCPGSIHQDIKDDAVISFRLVEPIDGRFPSGLFSRYLSTTPRTTVRDKRGKDSENNQSWLENMPDNILNTIVAFGGPDSIARLTVTNRALHERCSHDGLWQNICREYGKVCCRSASQSVTIIWYPCFSYVSVIDRPFRSGRFPKSLVRWTIQSHGKSCTSPY